MLTSLVIQDVVLIERLSLAFGQGLNVLTGETGAGKSILMDALAFALGARADSSLVREGTSQASVTACFEGNLPPALDALLHAHNLAAEDPLILRRTINRDGKSKAFINDMPVGATLLRQIGDFLFESHGQFETQGLLNPATHRGLLDSYARLAPQLKSTAEAYSLWQETEKNLTLTESERARSAAEAAFLRAAVIEIDEIAPEDNEIEILTEKRKTLQNREKITESLNACETLLRSDSGAGPKLAAAGKTLARVTDRITGTAEILAAVDRAFAEVDEACLALDRLMRDLASPEETLDFIEERLFRLRALARKHNVSPEELPALGIRLRERLDLLDTASDTVLSLRKKAAEARARYESCALDLRAQRAEAAKNLAQRVGKELGPLKMERATFTVSCEALPVEQWGPQGMDSVIFTASTNPGTPAGALHKIASGGELARFMLALKVVLADADPTPTLVFDEIDAGIGGRQASAVGERLAKLGRTTQVIVVTHSPQVAARGQTHLHVEKTVKKGQAFSHVALLDQAARIEEIARMLAGETTTPAARQAALSLIKDSHPKRAAS